MKKPPAFYAKLLGLMIVGISLASPTAMPALAKGDYKAFVASLGFAALVAVAYALDPNHASATQDQISGALLNGVSEVAKVEPLVAQITANPLYHVFDEQAADLIAKKIVEAQASKLTVSQVAQMQANELATKAVVGA